MKQISRLEREAGKWTSHFSFQQRSVRRRTGQHLQAKAGQPMAKWEDEEEVRKWLEENLPTWALREGQLYRRFDTANWRVTLMTANAVGFLAEAAYHHPKIVLNYRSVEIFLTTQDAGGLTQQDFDLAKKIEETVRWPRRGGDEPRSRPKEWLRS